jgi:mannose-1-phosphate guanylyltransferase
MKSGGAKSAILLVGGFGTRLQPLTFNIPKPMLPVAGIPFTEHQIAKARAAGIEEIVLATSFRAEVFEPYFGNGEKFGIRVSYAVEESALGTGGAIANAAKFLEKSGPVVIFNGDVLSSHDLQAQVDLHVSGGADVTLHLTEVNDARAFGVVELSKNRILTFNEKMENPPTNIINAGCYIFNQEVIDSIPTGRVVSVERETFPALIADGRNLLGYVDSAYWLDIGTPAALLQATKDLIAGTAESDAFDLLLERGEFFRSKGSLIAHSADIHPTALIEAGSLISRRVSINEESIIRASVLFDGARVGAGASLTSTFVAADTEIPAGFIAESQFFGFLE